MNPSIPSLEPSLCRLRQGRLQALVDQMGLDAAVVADRHFVHALTGFWNEQPLTPVASIICRDGRSTLVFPERTSLDSQRVEVDQKIVYEAQKLATIVEDPLTAMSERAQPVLNGLAKIGCDTRLPMPGSSAEWIDLRADYQYVRRYKDPDEIAILRVAIEAAEETFDEARRLLPYLPTEIDLYIAMHSVAVETVGEALSGWGNDFQSGSQGGQPRHRHVVPGEIAVYDIGVGIRGYRSDLCRSFAVNQDPTEVQQAAHARILEAFDYVESELKAGVSCSDLYNHVKAMLDGWEGLSFSHHLGHGIGLDAHEVPRLNPEWQDVLQVGDVIAVEPALYGPALNAGIRLEHNYRIDEYGAERLSAYPLDL